MNLKRWNTALAGAILCALALPVAAAAAPTADTVRVDGCVASKGAPALNWTGPFGSQETQPGLPANLMIDFANVSANPVTSVEFGLVTNGKVVTMVRDTGMFAPNARVMHAFGISESIVPANATSASCVPLRIQYADGTTWMNPNMPAH